MKETPKIIPEFHFRNIYIFDFQNSFSVFLEFLLSLRLFIPSFRGQRTRVNFQFLQVWQFLPLWTFILWSFYFGRLGSASHTQFVAFRNLKLNFSEEIFSIPAKLHDLSITRFGGPRISFSVNLVTYVSFAFEEGRKRF